MRKIFDNPSSLARAATEDFLGLARSAIAGSTRFTVALPGGSTPGPFYSHLAATSADAAAWWRGVHFFWGDERMVPRDHPDSNFRLANELLLSRLPIRPEQVHRVDTEQGSPGEVAVGYEEALDRFFQPPAGEVPVFDLVLLGVGTDGHTASLFPSSTALVESVRWVVAPWVESLQAHRITLTVPVLCRAKRVWFFATGAEKAEIVARILGPGPRQGALPAQRIRPQGGQPDWYLDRAAASRLPDGKGEGLR